MLQPNGVAVLSDVSHVNATMSCELEELLL